MKFKLGGLSRRLVQGGLLTEAQMQHACEQAVKAHTPLASYLVGQDILNSYAVAVAASQESGVPLLDLNAVDMEHAPTTLVEEKLVRKHHVLPLFKRGRKLFIAVSDLSSLQALDEIKFHVGANTEAVLVEEDKLSKAIEAALAKHDTSMSALTGADVDDLNLEISAGDEDLAAADGVAADIDDTPVVRFVNKVLLDAINKGASDVHFEPYEKIYRVRLRQDGVLREVATPPVVLAPRLAARLKVMSKLDISERRVPQDGRMKMRLSKNRAIDFRVSSCPTLYGEKIVLRILDPASAQLGIDALGYEEEQKKLFMDAIHRPYGMVLVTGPTGSGKTVSLYTALNILNTEDRNISTCEDPVEINLAGVNQVNVNPRAGLTFSTALKAFLRQDPDIIMVGEVRDLETAEIAIKAAQTGHMVLSTLHTNDAPQTLSRLANMGVAPFNIASAVSLIIAQRLARRLCAFCKQPVTIPHEALLKEGFKEAEIADIRLHRAVGCDQCSDGYKGRVGLYQVMPVSEAIGHIIMAGGNAMQIAEQAKKEGIADLRESGLRKVRQGITSLEEINRVTNE
ncbi:MAG: type IV-A pilus assembly ATPase PilB [Gammaproteobacteria bacterium]|nr:type IV-A pilus assembly ATPase PilB [Gammaproteobacteria bacterium]